MQHLQYKSPRCNIKIAGPFAPATSTFVHRTTAHFISLFCYPHPYKNRSPQLVTPPRFAPFYRTSSPLITVPKALPWQTNKILIFLIFPVFSGFSSLFTFLHFSLILAYLGISLHIFVINFGKNFGKFQVCTKGKSAIGNRQVRNWGLR